MKQGDIVNIRTKNGFIKGVVRKVYPHITFEAIEIEVQDDIGFVKSDWMFDYCHKDGVYYEVDDAELKNRWDARLDKERKNND